MKLTIDIEEKTVEVPNGTLINELIAHLKDLVGTEYSEYKLINDNTYIYYPIQPTYPVYPYPFYTGDAPDIPYKVTSSNNIQPQDNS